MEPTQDPDPTTTDARIRRQRGWLIAATVAVVALAVALVAVLVVDDDENDDVTVGTTSTSLEDTTTTSEEPTTTTTAGEATTSTTQPAGDGLPDPEIAAVWPDPDADFRYDQPVPAVRGFAEELVGFSDPVYGEFMRGDSRSGEVEVRPFEDGAVTTVFVRQLGDDNWYVMGAATDEIQLDRPASGEQVDQPLDVAGEARAFEGMVTVGIYALGDTTALGEDTVVAGGGAELEPFEGRIEYEDTDERHGVVVVTTSSGREGGAASAVAVPVGFPGAG